MKEHDISTINLRQFGILAGETSTPEKLSYLLALIYNNVNTRLASFLAPYHLSVTKFNVLVTVCMQNGGKGLNQIQMANHIIVTAPNLTKTLNSMEAADLVERQINPLSKRERLVRATRKGRSLVKAIYPEYTKLLAEFTGAIPEDKQDCMAYGLYRWLCNLNGVKLPDA